MTWYNPFSWFRKPKPKVPLYLDRHQDLLDRIHRARAHDEKARTAASTLPPDKREKYLSMYKTGRVSAAKHNPANVPKRRDDEPNYAPTSIASMLVASDPVYQEPAVCRAEPAPAIVSGGGGGASGSWDSSSSSSDSSSSSSSSDSGSSSSSSGD